MPQGLFLLLFSSFIHVYSWPKEELRPQWTATPCAARLAVSWPSALPLPRYTHQPDSLALSPFSNNNNRNRISKLFPWVKKHKTIGYNFCERKNINILYVYMSICLYICKWIEYLKESLRNRRQWLLSAERNKLVGVPGRLNCHSSPFWAFCILYHVHVYVFCCLVNIN